MATSILQTQNSFLVSVYISLTFFLLLLNKVNSFESVSFGFNKFEPGQQGLLFQGDATVSSTGRLQLTKVQNGQPVTNSVGRALYSEPVKIWDSTTGEVGNFVASFTFVINALNQSKTADGIAIFLAPVDTQPQSPGGLLGLFKDESYNKSNQILAVEFDTFSNEWDQPGTHFGINVNSIKSIETTSCDLESGQEVNVLLVYQPNIKGLNAFLIYPSLGKSYVIDAIVDVKEVLPEYVRVGLSSATGDLVQTHDVLSWGFDSNAVWGESIAHLLRSKLHDSM